jgi:hypothetical protein
MVMNLLRVQAPRRPHARRFGAERFDRLEAFLNGMDQ